MSHSKTGFAIAMGGGGARGYAHVGVMKVLEAEHLMPTLFSGTSMGSLVGVFFAAGFNASEVEEIFTHTSFWKLLDLNPFKDFLRFGEVIKLFEGHLPKRIEELKYPFLATATDLISGTEVYFREGEIAHAIRASIAYPGGVSPIWHGSRLLADGGLLNQIPVDGARFLGADRVLAVDVTPLEQLSESAPGKNWWEKIFKRGIEVNPVQVAMRSVEIMQIRLADVKLAISRPDLILRPKLEGIGLLGFSQHIKVIAEGERCTQENIDEIRRMLEGGQV